MASEQTLSLTVKVNTETGQLEVLSAKFKEAGEAGGKAEQSFLGLSKGAQTLLKDLGLIATMGGIIAFFKECFAQATADEEAMHRLQFAVEAQGNSWAKAKGPLKDWSEAIQESTRFSNTEALETLGKLSVATKSVTEAQQASQIAMGLSVAQGIPLNQATELMQGLMMGNSRAIMMAHRSLGEFTDGATTAQGMLDALNKHFATLANTETGAAKEQAQFKNAWEDFLKLVGSSLMPALSWILDGLTKVITATQLYGTVMGAVTLTVIEYFKTIGKVMYDALTGHWGDILRDTKAGITQVGYIMAATTEQFKEIETKKTAILKTELDKRVPVHAQASAKDLKAESDQAFKIEAIHADLEKKIQALGVDTFTKKMETAKLDYELERAKIIKEVEDKDEQMKLFKLLDREYDLTKKDLAEKQAQRNVALSFQTADTAVKTLLLLNDMGQKGNAAEKERAIAMMALQQAIAIGWIWVGVAKGVGTATIWSAPAAVALGTAQTVMLVAQFAQQVQALNRTSSSGAGSGISAALPGGSTPFGPVSGPTYPDLLGGEGPGGPAPPAGIIVGAGSAGQGGGQVINVSIPQINVNVAVETLQVADRRAILLALADELRSASVDAIRFAVTSANVAEANSQVAV